MDFGLPYIKKEKLFQSVMKFSLASVRMIPKLTSVSYFLFQILRINYF